MPDLSTAAGGRLLAGCRVVVTRPRDQADAFSRRLEALGAEPVPFATIRTGAVEDPAALDAAVGRLASYDWVIFTSVNGVRFAWEALARSGAIFPTGQTHVAAIGPATAAALGAHGVEADVVPDVFVAEAVAGAMGPVAGLSIVLLRADIARKALPEMLVARGARVEEVAAYRTLPVAPSEADIARIRAGVDMLTFTSSSTVRSFRAALGDEATEIGRRCVVACIGPITADTAREEGFRVDVVAQTYTTEGLIEALVAFQKGRAF